MSSPVPDQPPDQPPVADPVSETAPEVAAGRAPADLAGAPAVARHQRRPIAGALLRYRVMAIVTGIGLVILTFVGIPLQLWAHNDTVVAIAGTAHGYLYLVYLAATADLGLRLRWPLGRMLVIALAGTVPFCSFVAEHKVTARVRADRVTGGGADSLPS